MARFVRGAAIRIEVDITDHAGTPVTATPIVITVYNPNGQATVTDAAMTASGVTGTYYYNLQTAVADLVGTWKVLVAATVGTPVGRQDGAFELYAVV